MTRARVLLADDHALFLEGLEKLLAPHYEIVGKVQDGRPLVEAAKALDPDVIVADISMPDLSGTLAAQEIREAALKAKVILLTMHEDAQYAIEALQSGVAGYVVKHAASTELLTAITEALQGRMYVTPRVAKEVFAAVAGDPQVKPVLTPRQHEILALLASGLSAKQIAARLDLSPRTVEHHKYRLMEELGLRSTAELIQYAVKQGLV